MADKEPGVAATDKPSPVLTIPSKAIAPFVPTASLTSRLLTEDSIWKGAILVEGMVTVAPQATLTIAPGTIVRFGADSGLLVFGRVVAKGTADSQIILTSQYLEPRANDWYGMVITGSNKKNVLEQTTIHGAQVAVHGRSSSLELRNLRIDSSSTAVDLKDSLVNMKNIGIAGCGTGVAAVKSEIDLEAVTIEQGKTGMTMKSSSMTAEKLKFTAISGVAMVAEKSQLKIDRGYFSGNAIGARISASEGSISSSRFTANSDVAVVMGGSLLRFSANTVSGNKIGLQVEDSLPSLWGNAIYGNNDYNLLYLGDEKLFAGGNWFGMATGESFNKSIFTRNPDTLLILPLLPDNPLHDSVQDFQ